MRKKEARAIFASLCLISLQTLPAQVWVIGFGSAANAANTAGQGESAQQVKDSITLLCKEIQTLVQDYYPRAKIASIDKTSVHFEDKCHTEQGYYSSKLELVPQEGGILGEVALKSGEYEGRDKDRLPARVADGFHTTLTMAPYFSSVRGHLLVRLTYPTDCSGEFQDKFNSLINDFAAKYGAPTASAAPAQKTNNAPQAAASVPAPPASSAAAPQAASAPAAAQTQASAPATQAAATPPPGAPATQAATPPPGAPTTQAATPPPSAPATQAAAPATSASKNSASPPTQSAGITSGKTAISQQAAAPSAVVSVELEKVSKTSQATPASSKKTESDMPLFDFGSAAATAIGGSPSPPQSSSSLEPPGKKGPASPPAKPRSTAVPKLTRLIPIKIPPDGWDYQIKLRGQQTYGICKIHWFEGGICGGMNISVHATIINNSPFDAHYALYTAFFDKNGNMMCSNGTAGGSIAPATSREASFDMQLPHGNEALITQYQMTYFDAVHEIGSER